MCRAVVNLNDIQYSKDDTIPTPSWIPLKKDMDDLNGDDGPMILCAFQKIRFDQKFNTPLD